MSKRSFFVTGTDTGTGKTLFACALIRALRADGALAAGIKPVETGCEHGEDHDLIAADGRLLNAQCDWVPPYVVAPYRFRPAVAPVVAAEAAGMDLRLADLTDVVTAARRYADTLVIEGAGGALSPIASDGHCLDLAKACESELYICANNVLGCQSATLAAIECARRRELTVKAVVLGPAEDEAQQNAQIIARFGDVTIIDVPKLSGDDAQKIEQLGKLLSSGLDA